MRTSSGAGLGAPASSRRFKPFEVAIIALALASCSRSAPATSAPVEYTTPDPPAVYEQGVAGKTIELGQIRIRSSTGTSGLKLPMLFNCTGVLPLPEPAGQLMAVGLGLSMTNGHRAISIHVDGPSGVRYEISRESDSYMASVGSSVVDGIHGVRLVTLEGRSTYDPTSLIYYILPWPELRWRWTVVSRRLAAGSPVETRRIVKETNGSMSIVAVDDCDGDKQDDFLLVEQRGTECTLLSGSSLKTIATIPVDKDFGGDGPEGSVCVIPDVDGDQLRDILVIAMDVPKYWIISPGMHKVLPAFDLDSSLNPSRGVYSACNVGKSARGEPWVAISYQRDEDVEKQVSRVVVLDLLTGRALSGDQAACMGIIYGRRMASGRMADSVDRRWIAYSAWKEDPSRRNHLFVAELGVPDSIVEVLLPQNDRAYASEICAVPVEGGQSDCLAITVSPIQVSNSFMSFDPIQFLDVSTCFGPR